MLDLLKPKSLLKCTNPMNVPHYLQKISHRIHDNYSFEPDAETSERLC